MLVPNLLGAVTVRSRSRGYNMILTSTFGSTTQPTPVWPQQPGLDGTKCMLLELEDKFS